MKNWIGAFALLIISLSASAQSQGKLNGYVRHELNGAALSGWRIQVVQGEFEAESTSGDDGAFSFGNLPTGLCNVRAVSPQGQKLTIHEVRITAAKPTHLPIIIQREQTELQEATVSAQAFQTTAETPLSVKNINWSEMQRMPGATLDLSKVIQSFPGSLPKASFGYAISLRGGAPTENAYLMDDIVLPTVNHFSIQGASGGAVGLINLDHVQDMALITGAFPAETGEALSGVLSLTGRNGRTDRWGSRITLGATDYGITLEGPLSKQSSLTASARYSFSQHYFKLFKIPVLPTYSDAQFRYHHRISDRADLVVLGVAGWDLYELYLTGGGDGDALMYNIGYIPEGNQNVSVLGARFRQYTDNGHWQAVVSHDQLQHQAEKYIGNTDDPNHLQRRYDAFERNHRASIKHFVAWGNWTWNYGGNFISRYYGADAWGLRQEGTSVTAQSMADSMRVQSLGAFTSVSGRWIDDRLEVSAGLRADYHSLNSSTRRVQDLLAPRVSVSYQLQPNWSLNANWTQSTQLPPGIMLLANHDALRNDASRAGRITQQAAGVEYQNGQTYRVSMEVYHKQYQNAAYLLADQMPFAQAIGSYVAVGDQIWSADAEGRAQGLELFLQQKLKGQYWWMASYNLGRSETKHVDDAEWRPSVWDSRHHLSATWGRVWGKGWQIGLKWRYSSGTAYTPYDSAASSLKSNWDQLQRGVFDYDQAGMGRLGSFTQLDFRIDKSYIRKNYTIQWYLDIQNMLRDPYPLMPYLIVERDEDGNNVTHPDDPTRYVVRTIASDTGRPLPTLGIILEF